MENTNNEKLLFGGINSFYLRIFAMAAMLMDHLWATIVTGNSWMTYVGRLAYPIFAFLLVEGFFHTKNLKKYMLRMLLFAVISEIPFNIITGGGIIFPFHQNVLFTFLLGLSIMWVLEKIKQRQKLWLTIISGIAALILGFVLGTVTMVDYFGFGILMILTFYFAYGKSYGWMIQLFGMFFINAKMMAGRIIQFTLGGAVFGFPLQGIAVLSLLLIWLYNGKRGTNNKIAQYSFYAFYPLHMLIIGLIWALG